MVNEISCNIGRKFSGADRVANKLTYAKSVGQPDDGADTEPVRIADERPYAKPNHSRSNRRANAVSYQCRRNHDAHVGANAHGRARPGRVAPSRDRPERGRYARYDVRNEPEGKNSLTILTDIE